MLTQEKADQIDLVVREAEVVEPTTEEDLIIQEAIKAVITKKLDVEAYPTNSETFMEAHDVMF